MCKRAQFLPPVISPEMASGWASALRVHWQVKSATAGQSAAMPPLVAIQSVAILAVEHWQPLMLNEADLREDKGVQQ